MNIFTALLRAEADAEALRKDRHDELINLFQITLGVITTMSNRTDTVIADLVTKVTKLESAADAANTLITSLATEIRNGVSTAKDAGATDEQLSELTDLANSADAKTTDLSMAITANTPSDPAASPEPTTMPVATPGDQAPQTVDPVTAAAGPASGTAGTMVTADGVTITQPIAATAAAGPAASPQLADSTGASNPPAADPDPVAVQTPSVAVGVQPASAPASNVNQ